ncbi:tyrosine phosphatase-like protein [Limtongia smithiae]|uniref:tyrosine phosphatase-like protein n=1 Tax=Limtongia smithiae TaxID=1125753 RepID=UPI0034CE9744
MSTRPSSGKPTRLTPQGLYLLAYNTISAFLWTAVLMRVAIVLPLLGSENVAAVAADFTRWVQTGALLEIVHSLIGLVRAPVFTTGMQVASRLFLTWGVVWLFPETGGETLAYSTMLICWSITEIVRYSFYASNLKGTTPKWLTYIRYTAFFVLYPAGVASELLVTTASLKQARHMSVAYEYFMIGVMLIYIPGFYTLFTHMIRQRRRVIRDLFATPEKKRAI